MISVGASTASDLHQARQLDGVEASTDAEGRNGISVGMLSAPAPSGALKSGGLLGGRDTEPRMDAAIEGALLQRSTSAPPVADNVAGWAGSSQAFLRGAGSTGATADSLNLDYYYYYYAPHSLNPRLPRESAGSGKGGPSSSAADSSGGAAGDALPPSLNVTNVADAVGSGAWPNAVMHSASPAGLGGSDAFGGGLSGDGSPGHERRSPALGSVVPLTNGHMHNDSEVASSSRGRIIGNDASGGRENSLGGLGVIPEGFPATAAPPAAAPPATSAGEAVAAAPGTAAAQAQEPTPAAASNGGADLSSAGGAAASSTSTGEATAPKQPQPQQQQRVNGFDGPRGPPASRLPMPQHGFQHGHSAPRGGGGGYGQRGGPGGGGAYDRRGHAYGSGRQGGATEGLEVAMQGMSLGPEKLLPQQVPRFAGYDAQAQQQQQQQQQQQAVQLAQLQHYRSMGYDVDDPTVVAAIVSSMSSAATVGADPALLYGLDQRLPAAADPRLLDPRVAELMRDLRLLAAVGPGGVRDPRLAAAAAAAAAGATASSGAMDPRLSGADGYYAAAVAAAAAMQGMPPTYLDPRGMQFRPGPAGYGQDQQLYDMGPQDPRRRMQPEMANRNGVLMYPGAPAGQGGAGGGMPGRDPLADAYAAAMPGAAGYRYAGNGRAADGYDRNGPVGNGGGPHQPYDDLHGMGMNNMGNGLGGPGGPGGPGGDGRNNVGMRPYHHSRPPHMGGRGRGPGHGGRNGGHGGGMQGGRGSLLDEFRSSIGRGRRWELQDLQGHIVQFCRDQHGSRFIQQRLEVATEAEKRAFFDEILPHAFGLMTDVFGNYVIQKLFDHGDAEQRENLASFLVGHAVQLSLQMYGCRVVQKALEFASVHTLIALVSEFTGQVMKCVQDQNGNHVIQKCIEVVSATANTEGAYLHSHIQFIVDAFANQVEKLSTHAYGCRVIQRILEHCIDEQKDPVLVEINVAFSSLIQDQYGNYVIQHVLKHGRPADRLKLMTEVRVHLLPYSQHKFASNVVEKCLQYGTKEERGQLIQHLLYSANDGHSLLQVMVCDPYANYVVQKIIDVADEEQRETIIAEIRAHAAQLKRYTFGKHIISRLEKISGKKM